jgi:hypothetical protein
VSDTTITDKVTGLTLTLHHGPPQGNGTMRTRYRIGGFGPTGDDEADLSATQWMALNELVDRWREEA